VNVPVAATDDLSPPHSSPARIPAADQEPDQFSADARRKPIDQKGAGQFQGELKEEVEHSRVMMALALQHEKAGKSGHRPSQNRVQLFPPLRLPGYFLC
jgi:hypothetical protein